MFAVVVHHLICYSSLLCDLLSKYVSWLVAGMELHSWRWVRGASPPCPRVFPGRLVRSYVMICKTCCCLAGVACYEVISCTCSQFSCLHFHRRGRRKVVHAAVRTSFHNVNIWGFFSGTCCRPMFSTSLMAVPLPVLP